MRKLDKERTWDEFDIWKKETDKLIDLNVILKDVSNSKHYSFKNKRRKLIEELYIIKEGKEIVVSSGTMIWLFLGGTDKDSKMLTNYSRKKHWERYLEEMKICHRIELFGIKTEKIDRNKVKELLEV